MRVRVCVCVCVYLNIYFDFSFSRIILHYVKIFVEKKACRVRRDVISLKKCNNYTEM